MANFYKCFTFCRLQGGSFEKFLNPYGCQALTFADALIRIGLKLQIFINALL